MQYRSAQQEQQGPSRCPQGPEASSHGQQRSSCWDKYHVRFWQGLRRRPQCIFGWAQLAPLNRQDSCFCCLTLSSRPEEICLSLRLWSAAAAAAASALLPFSCSFFPRLYFPCADILQQFQNSTEGRQRVDDCLIMPVISRRINVESVSSFYSLMGAVFYNGQRGRWQQSVALSGGSWIRGWLAGSQCQRACASPFEAVAIRNFFFCNKEACEGLSTWHCWWIVEE